MPVLIPLLAALAAAGPEGAAAVQDVARTAVSRRLDAIGRPMQVDVDAIRLMPGATGVVPLAADVPGPLPRARVDVPVRVLIDGRATTVTVHVALHDIRTVATYARAYRRGTAVTDVVHVQRRLDLAGVRATPVATPPATGVLAHDVEADAPVLEDDVTVAPTVAAGDRVSLEAVSGRIAIATPARALESGRRGDRIQVISDASPRAVRARILDTGRVTVDE